MTVEHTVDIASKTYTAGAGQVEFEFPVKVRQASDLGVYVDDVVQTDGVDYSGVGYGADDGVTITFTSPLTAGQSVLIELDMRYSQSTDYETGSTFTAESHEEALDNLNLLIRQNRRLIGKTLRLGRHSPLTDTVIPDPTPNAFLRANGDGTNVTWVDPDIIQIGTADAQDITYSGGTNVEAALDELYTLTPEPGPTTAADITYTTYGASNVAARLNRLEVTPYDFGAVGSGLVNDAGAFQDWADYMAANNVSGFIPPGTYRLDTKITLDYTGLVAYTDTSGFSIRGAGSRNTNILNNHSDYAFEVVTDVGSANWITRSVISGLKFTSGGSFTGGGIYLNGAAGLHVDDLFLFGLDQAFDGVDVLSCQFHRIGISSCNYGMHFARATGSRPNAISLYGCHINAREWGITMTEPTTFSMYGGSIEGCGKLGDDGNRYGVKFVDSGVIGGGINFHGVHMEGNGPIADVWIDGGTNACTYTFMGCTFDRTEAAHVAEFAIRVNQLVNDGEIDLVTIGNSFKGFNDYVHDASRPWLGLFSAGIFRRHAIGDYYESTVERPQRASSGCFANFRFNGGVASPVMARRHGVESAVTKSSTGVYVVTFEIDSPITGKTTIVQRIGEGRCYISAETSNTITIRTEDTAGDPEDAFVVGVVYE